MGDKRATIADSDWWNSRIYSSSISTEFVVAGYACASKSDNSNFIRFYFSPEDYNSPTFDATHRFI